MFLGFGCSGHTWIGCLLDAHPNVIIATEYNVLGHIHEIRNKEFLFKELKSRSAYVRREFHPWKGYHILKGLPQGQCEGELKLIGDKMGGASSNQIYQDRNRFTKLLKLLTDTPMNVIIYLRNPYDIITTQFLNFPRYKNDFDLVIKNFVNRCEGIQLYLSEFSTACNTILLTYESVIQDSQAFLKTLSTQLDIPHNKLWYDTVIEKFYTKPHRSRFDGHMTWTQYMKDKVKNEIIDSYNFFGDYSWND